MKCFPVNIKQKHIFKNSQEMQSGVLGNRSMLVLQSTELEHSFWHSAVSKGLSLCRAGRAVGPNHFNEGGVLSQRRTKILH